MSKVRVYEVAKQLNMDQKALVTLFQSMGMSDVKNHMSAVDTDVIDRVKRHLEKAKSPSVVEERIRPTVVKRARVGGPPSVAPPSARTSVAMPPASSRTSVSMPPASSREVHAFESGPSARGSQPIAAPAARSSRVAVPEAAPPSVRPSRLATPAAPKSMRAPLVVDEAPPPPPFVDEVADVEPARETNGTMAAAARAEATPTLRSIPPEPVASVEAPPSASMAPPVMATTPSGPPHAHMPSVSASAPSAPPASASAAPGSSAAPAPPTARPKTGIQYWGGREGVPMQPPPPPRAPLPARTGPQQPGRRYEVSNAARPGGGVAATTMRPGQQSSVRPGMGNRPGQYGRPRPGMMGQRRPGAVSTKEMSSDKKVIRIEERVNLQTLASRMSLKATEVLMKLIQMGKTGVNINSTLDADDATLVASEFGWGVEDVAVDEATQLAAARGPEHRDEEGLEVRAPIVTVMGHVDHGKTSLLDQIRKANVATGEAGGITQHVGAYRVQTPMGPITFLDTPGHEAFTQMRARGANVTDIVVLVVAADDGVMPQTREAVQHAKAAKVPIIVAVNKMDKPDAEPEKVKRQLMELELVPEEFGGSTAYVSVSAKTRMGIDDLLERISLEAEVLELRANPKRPAHGTVVEALLDRGKGPVARVLVTDGTLRAGDFLLCGPAFGKVRAMTDDRGKIVVAAGPGTPVEVLGLTDVPNAGDQFDVVRDKEKAQEIAQSRRDKTRQSLPATSGITMAELAERIALQDQLDLRLIIKADVQGSVEAIAEAVQRLTTEKVKLTVVGATVGAITEGDVNLAIASKAIIVGFNVRPAGKAAALAESEGVEIRQYSIIYALLDDVRRVQEGLLPPTLIEKPIGKAEVRAVFKLSKSGIVAGCMITEGTIRRAARARLRRGADIVFEGKIAGLKRFKDDVKEVGEGFECGISLDNFETIKDGDIVEAYEVEEIRTKL